MFNPLILLESVASKIHPPACIIMGSTHMVVDLASRLPETGLVCFQMDLFQGNRIREELATIPIDARVEVLPDLWDLPAEFNTVIFPVPKHGERELKLDLLEQSFHILKPGGMLLSLSEYKRDLFLPKWHKKVFGRCSELPGSKTGSIFWSIRDREQPRRRHELEFHARVGQGPSHTFLSRPGVFSYGRMDAGARALVEVASILPGDRVLDLGCGVGTNGVIAADRSGPEGHITFVDSNVRAVKLAEHNARANGLQSFSTVASYHSEGLPRESFDVILANPPYYAHSSIARRFIEESRPLLKRGGRFYLVTKQVSVLAPLVVEVFGETAAHDHRGYHILETMIPEPPA